MNDETMSLDPAFSSKDIQNESFKFDGDEVSTQASQTETDKGTETESSDETSSPVGNDEEEQKVPYSRFEKKVKEINEYQSTIKRLEEEINSIKSQNSSRNTQESETELPNEWKELYGDGEAAKKAYQVQLKYLSNLEEKAAQSAYERMIKEQQAVAQKQEENEQFVDNSLQELSENLGIKMTPKLEEELLNIVDKYSPTGDDGKYIAPISFDKAYEIYKLQNSVKVQKVQSARESVANLTRESSLGETSDRNTAYKPSWDSWRDGLN